MYDSAFTPTGNCTLVGLIPIAIRSGRQAHTSFRVRNLLTTAQYFTWSPIGQISGNLPPPPALTATPPTASTPSPRTIGMAPSSIETFTLPSDFWVAANADACFEFIGGEGI